MIFEQIATGGCQSYLVGCADSNVAAVIDPEASQIDRYVALAARKSLRIRYVIDTHTHADHFSASRETNSLFIITSASVWLLWPLCMERTRQRSSAIAPSSGMISESSMPHWPRRWRWRSRRRAARSRRRRSPRRPW